VVPNLMVIGIIVLIMLVMMMMMVARGALEEDS